MTAPAKKYQTVEQVFERIYNGFHEKYPNNEKLQKAVQGKTRRIAVELSDHAGAGYLLANNTLKRVPPAELGKPDIRIQSTSADLLALFNRELKPIEAYFTKRIRIDASMSDLLLAKSFLG